MRNALSAVEGSAGSDDLAGFFFADLLVV